MNDRPPETPARLPHPRARDASPPLDAIRAVWPTLVRVRKRLEAGGHRQGYLLALILEHVARDWDRLSALEDIELRTALEGMSEWFADRYRLSGDESAVAALAILRDALL